MCNSLLSNSLLHNFSFFKHQLNETLYLETAYCICVVILVGTPSRYIPVYAVIGTRDLFNVSSFELLYSGLALKISIYFWEQGHKVFMGLPGLSHISYTKVIQGTYNFT